MKDFCCNNPDDMCYNEIKEKARRIKDIGEGYDMRLQHSKLSQEYLIEDRKELIEDIFTNGNSLNLSDEQIASAFQLPIKLVQEIKESIKV